MKTNSDKWQVTSDRLAAARGEKSRHPSSLTRNGFGFTLIELLVVISIIGVLAGLTFPVLKSLKGVQQKRVARAELEVIQTALDNYKAKYGTYPPGNAASALVPQLYYELSGVRFNSSSQIFTTLDGRYVISKADVQNAYGVDGIVNCSVGSGDDDKQAKNFLIKFNEAKQSATVTNDSFGKKVYPTTAIITSVGGPDPAYQPLGGEDLNPIRYQYPGVRNPGSYDLWIQLKISGKTNLICNWSRQVTINSPLP
jgi:prepilin-type N-terminal cleavage/methylation domain-containing protein